jgi:hypothetical protein
MEDERDLAEQQQLRDVAGGRSMWPAVEARDRQQLRLYLNM